MFVAHELFRKVSAKHRPKIPNAVFFNPDWGDAFCASVRQLAPL